MIVVFQIVFQFWIVQKLNISIYKRPNVINVLINVLNVLKLEQIVWDATESIEIHG